MQNYWLKKKNSNVDVKLITTNDYGKNSHRDSLKILIEKKEENATENAQMLLLVAIVLLIFGLVTLIFIIGIPILIVSIILLVLALQKKTVYSSKIPLTVIDQMLDFTHAKVYLIDDKIGVVGSANFTETGFWKNLEAITVLKGEKLVKELNEAFELLEEHPLKKIIPIEEVAKAIYPQEVKSDSLSDLLLKHK